MCALYTKTILDEIRERVPIVAFIGERVELKKVGRNFRGRCPFHNEKTPSFHVSDDRSMYHCFGCGEGGDLFAFVMKFEGIPFPDAVKMLADRAGVKLPTHADPAELAREDEATRKRRMYLRVNEIARDYFCKLLNDEKIGEKARTYLQERGIKREFFTQLLLGYADNSWEMLGQYLREKGAPLELAAELGLLKKRESGGYYDFFRDRLIFPIISPRGEVMGFSGRDLSGAENAAKYVNSPDSALYHKSSSLFGLDRAQAAIRKQDAVLLVEGNLDLTALHQAGIEHVVAPLGTALTAGHVRLLSRYTRNMTVLFDGDEAGLRAALRSLEIFSAEGISARIVPLPSGEDPDSLVRKEGAQPFRKRIEVAPALFDFFVEQTLLTTGSDSAGKAKALSSAVGELRCMQDDAQRSVATAHLARRLGIDQASIAAMLHAGKGMRREGAAASNAVARTTERGESAGVLSVERLLMELLIKRPEFAAHVLSEFSPDRFEDEWCRSVALLMQAKISSGGEGALGNLTEGLVDEEFMAELRSIALGPDRCGDDEAEQFVNDCLSKLKGRPLKQRLSEINDDIRHAEMSGDEARLFALLDEKKNLVRQI